MIVAAFLTVTVTVSEYVLVLHRDHCLVINVQPRLTATTATTPSNPSTNGIATGVRVKHVEGIVAPVSGDIVVIEHAVEGIARRATTSRRHDLYREHQPPSLKRTRRGDTAHQMRSRPLGRTVQVCRS